MSKNMNTSNLKNNKDLYYVVYHDADYDPKNPPLPNKLIAYQSSVYLPHAYGLDCYRYLLGKEIRYVFRKKTTIFKNLEEKDLTYLALFIDAREFYTINYNLVENFNNREFDLACGKFTDALQVYDGLSSKQRQSAIKKDPIYEIVYLTDVQKELYRAKGYMLKSIADAKFIKLIDEAILDPKKLGNNKLKKWFLDLFENAYKLRFEV